MVQEDTLRVYVGKADVFELLSCLFAFPDMHVAEGLSAGTIAEDVGSCLVDMGVNEAEVAEAVVGFVPWRGTDPSELLASMRITYSELYLTPGGHTPIQPYESAFIHVERGLASAPALFRTPVTLDVERCMREAGVVPKDARKEPCDSVFQEFAYLSYLYAQLADAIHHEDTEAADTWRGHIDTFESTHTTTWLPAFMTRTQELAVDSPYATFAAFASAALKA